MNFCRERSVKHIERLEDMHTKRTSGGFTLIELIIVIAILAFVAVIGLHSYGNLKEVEAKKMNMANIKRVYHALSTYETIEKEQAEIGFFNGFDSLIDVTAGGGWTGSAGTFEWGVDTGGGDFSTRDARTVHSGLGIYDGSWKVLGSLYNAAGQGSGSTDTVAEAQEKNKGTRETGLYKKLGIYYLTASDVQLLRNAGISYYFMHNPSTQQAYGTGRNGFCTAVATENGISYSSAADGKLKVMGGGPGFRPDMSAFYPVALTNGSPVAVLQPGDGAYDDFGYSLSLTNSTFTASEASAALSSVKLVCFGIGRNAECVRNQFGLGEAPVNPFYDKRHYRYYIAVFAIKAGGQGVPASCRLAGVLDAAGNTYKQAEYNVNWTTKLGN